MGTATKPAPPPHVAPPEVVIGALTSDGTRSTACGALVAAVRDGGKHPGSIGFGLRSLRRDREHDDKRRGVEHPFHSWILP